MCGRYVSPDDAAIERAWQLGRTAPNPLRLASSFARHFNVRPTTKVPMIHREREGATDVARPARWGFIPHWWKQPKMPTFTINARAEEAAAKPMWRGPYRNGRCLIPAEGWYEWPEKEDIDPVTGEITEVGQPHYIFRADREPFCFAGLMSWWTPPGDTEPAPSCAILTQAGAPSVAPVHDRSCG